MNKTSRLVKIISNFSFLKKSYLFFTWQESTSVLWPSKYSEHLTVVVRENHVDNLTFSLRKCELYFLYVVITLKVLFYKPELKLIIVGIFNFISFLDFFFFFS